MSNADNKLAERMIIDALIRSNPLPPSPDTDALRANLGAVILRQYHRAELLQRRENIGRQ